MSRSLTLNLAVSFSYWTDSGRAQVWFDCANVSRTATIAGPGAAHLGEEHLLIGRRCPRHSATSMISTLAPMEAGPPAVAPQPVRHNGFTLEVRASRRESGAWGYAVLHEGNLLHSETGGYRTPRAAALAARALVDDAITSWERVMG